MDMWSTKLGNEAMGAMISMSHSIKDINKKLDNLNLKADKTITDDDIEKKCDNCYKHGLAEGMEDAANNLFDTLTFYLAYNIATSDDRHTMDKDIAKPILNLLVGQGFCLDEIFEEVYIYVDKITKANEPKNAVIMSKARTIGLDMAVKDIDYIDFIKENNNI